LRQALNASFQIIGIEYVGVKQFGVAPVVQMLRERFRQIFGIDISEDEAEAFTRFMRGPEAELALSK
jgi:hypothetical protein